MFKNKEYIFLVLKHIKGLFISKLGWPAERDSPGGEMNLACVYTWCIKKFTVGKYSLN